MRAARRVSTLPSPSVREAKRRSRCPVSSPRAGLPLRHAGCILTDGLRICKVGFPQYLLADATVAAARAIPRTDGQWPPRPPLACALGAHPLIALVMRFVDSRG